MPQLRVFGYRVIKSEMRKERNLTIQQGKTYVNLMENRLKPFGPEMMIISSRSSHLSITPHPENQSGRPARDFPWRVLHFHEPEGH